MVKECLIKVVGLCQINDIIPILLHVNNIQMNPQGPEILYEIYEEDNDKVIVPSVAQIEEFIQRQGIMKKGYDVKNMKVYLLVSSLHNKGVGCAGTAPLISPLAVYLVEENREKNGGIYCNLTKAYDKLRELIEKYFNEMKYNAPLVLITPDLNKAILKQQLHPKRIPLKIRMEELEGKCTRNNIAPWSAKIDV